MSPILTRPIREQLEHDRIIRQLQARYKRKHEVVINPGAEQNQSVMVGDLAVYPDLLLYSVERSRRLEGTVEVETGESVNQLEALAEWGVYSKLKAAFHLYVPPQSIDTARRICEEQKFPVAEIWTYHSSLDQVRFTMVYRSPAAAKAAAAAAARGTSEKSSADQAPKTAVPKVAAKPAPAAKPAAAAKAAPVAKAAPPAVKPAAVAKAGPAGKAGLAAKSAKPAKHASRTVQPSQAAKPARPAASSAAKSKAAKGSVKTAKPSKPAKAAAGKRAPAAKKRR